MRKVYILGGHCTRFLGKGHPDYVTEKHPDFGKRQNPTIEELILMSVRGAIHSTGSKPELVQTSHIGNSCGEFFSHQGHLGAAVVGADPAFRFIESFRVDASGASGAIAFAQSVQSILAGADVSLASGVELESSVKAREAGGCISSGIGLHHDVLEKTLDDDFPIPKLMVPRMKEYMARYGVTFEDLGLIAVKANANANRNRKAQMHHRNLTIEMTRDPNINHFFTRNPETKPLLRSLDFCPLSDGAASVVVVSEEGLRKLGKSKDECVEVLNVTTCTNSLFKQIGDSSEFGNMKEAARRAYAASNTTPKQMNIAEIHDGHALAALMSYEALGFAELGKSINSVKDGKFDIDGALPCNTGGGYLSIGHPMGATGVRQILDIYHQMKGLAEGYQVKNIPEYGIAALFGGDDKTSVASVLRNC